MTAKSIVSRIVAFIVVLCIGVGINYLFLPAWNVIDAGMYGFLLSMSLIATFVFFVVEKVFTEDKHLIITIVPVVYAIVIIIIVVVATLVSLQIFNVDKYQSLIEIEEGNFENDVVANNIHELAVVDVATAEKVGDRTIAGLKNPSWYELDNEYNLIIYNGKQYRISCINYGGFFEYNKAKNSGIPGYVLVDAVTQEAKLVTLDSPIQYSPSAYFF